MGGLIFVFWKHRVIHVKSQDIINIESGDWSAIIVHFHFPLFQNGRKWKFGWIYCIRVVAKWIIHIKIGISVKRAISSYENLECQQNAFISSKKPQIKKIRPLYFLQLLKFEKANHPYFFNLRPHSWAMDVFLPPHSTFWWNFQRGVVGGLGSFFPSKFYIKALVIHIKIFLAPWFQILRKVIINPLGYTK